MTSETKVVVRAAKAAPRSPDPPPKMRMPGYSGYIPGALNTMEQNYFQVTRHCYEDFKRLQGRSHNGSADPQFHANVKPRLHTAPPNGGAKFLPGYGGFIPGQRFKFETSEGTLARTWAPRRPGHEAHSASQIGSTYKPPKPRIKMRQDKYIVGYTGALPGYQGEIEQSYARIARGVELGDIKPSGPHMPAGDVTVGGGAPSYMHKTMPSAPPDYKLPGYTGYVPQQKYTFEQRYSSSVDAAKAGITGVAGFRFGGGTHLNR